jgi:hypothetical protein
MMVCGAVFVVVEGRWCVKGQVQELLEVPAFAWSGECLEKEERTRKASDQESTKTYKCHTRGTSRY